MINKKGKEEKKDGGGEGNTGKGSKRRRRSKQWPRKNNQLNQNEPSTDLRVTAVHPSSSIPTIYSIPKHHPLVDRIFPIQDYRHSLRCGVLTVPFISANLSLYFSLLWTSLIFHSPLSLTSACVAPPPTIIPHFHISSPERGVTVKQGSGCKVVLKGTGIRLL